MDHSTAAAAPSNNVIPFPGQASNETRQPATAGSKWMPWVWQALHIAIIVHLIVGAGYAGWQVFTVVPPSGEVGPLWDAAASMPTDLLMVRRMYALESWLATGAAAVYLALTEFGPRRRAALARR
jgi:hypothetical protein